MCCRPLSSLLQQFIDNKFKQTNIFIILCGSSMSFMENQVLGYQSPLYGRRTGQFKLEPFEFDVSRQYHKKFDNQEQAILYGITGGVPQYLELMNGDKPLRHNIIHSFFTPDTMLFEEPANLLKQELREPQVYNDIITAIACGRWWGANPLRKEEQEIDLIAFDDRDTQALFCECKWTNEKVHEGVIKALVDKCRMFGHEKKHYCLFSRSGFTAAAQRMAGDEIRLVCFDDMF